MAPQTGLAWNSAGSHRPLKTPTARAPLPFPLPAPVTFGIACATCRSRLAGGKGKQAHGTQRGGAGWGGRPARMLRSVAVCFVTILISPFNTEPRAACSTITSVSADDGHLRACSALRKSLSRGDVNFTVGRWWCLSSCSRRTGGGLRRASPLHPAKRRHGQTKSHQEMGPAPDHGIWLRPCVCVVCVR